MRYAVEKRGVDYMNEVLSSRRIGDIETEKDSSSSKYTLHLFVPESELSALEPEIGDRAAWSPAEAYVRSVRKTSVAPGAWILDITAEEGDESSGLNLMFSSSDLENYNSCSFDVGEVYFNPDWFGVRRASVADCADYFQSGRMRDGLTRYMNIRGAWAVPGDLIFCNAVPLVTQDWGTKQLTSAAVGSMRTDLSPLTQLKTEHLFLAGQHVQTRIFHCSFCTSRKPSSINAFSGVSGVFGNSCNPGRRVSGAWKALSQTVTQVRSSRGRVYSCVKRSMLEAPLGLVWSPERAGGEWKW